MKKKKIKSQSNPKILLPKPPNSNRQSNRYKYTIVQQQDTIYVDSNGEEQTTSKIDLSDIKTIEIVQIGFYENKIGEIQAVKMPKTIQKVPDQLPSEITSTKQMFQSASSFDQDISGWDVSNVITIHSMFAGAITFDQNLSQWNVSKVIIHDNFAINSWISNSIDKLPNFNF